MNCNILGIFIIFLIETSHTAGGYRTHSTPHCDYSNHSFQIVCNGESYVSRQCTEKIFGTEMEEVRSSIKYFKIIGCKKSILEENILSYFNGVLELGMSSLGLTTLIPEKITTPKLLKLNISHNSLNKVETKIFNQTPNLSEIDYSYNKISELRSFAGAQNLEIMNFSHNHIFYLHAGAFMKLTKLRSLDLSFNKIGTIEKNMFIENRKLEILRLEMNQVYRFDGNIFTPLMNSASLSISCGEVKELDLSSVGKALNVDLKHDNKIVFRVSGNNTLTCSKVDFKGLYYFNISGNQLRNVYDVIEFFESSVEILDLSFNFLGNLNSITFSRFRNLRNLILSHSNLTYIPLNAFLELSLLRILDLSHNDLSSLDFGDKVFSQLHTLHLDFNRLTEIDSVTPEKFPSLNKFTVTNNKFSCTYLEGIYRLWSNLEVAANCKVETLHEVLLYEVQQNTTTTDTLLETTEGLDTISETFEEFETTPHPDEDFESDTEELEFTETFDNFEITLNESPNEITTEITTEAMDISTFQTSIKELSTEFEIVDEIFTTKQQEANILRAESKNKVVISDFWIQLQIVQFILVVFGILYLVINAIQRIIVKDRRRYDTYDKDQQDEFQTIELNSQEFAMH